MGTHNIDIDLRLLLLGTAFCLSTAAASELGDAFKGRDVNKTIAKVEAILARNPALPRLTRGEILALFENITRADAAKMSQQELKTMVEAPRPDKPLTVVLPYSADANRTGMEELYTRPPITRIVGEGTTTTPTPETAATTTTKRPKKRRKNGTRRKPTNQEVRPVYVSETRSTTASPNADGASWKPMVTEGSSPVKKDRPENGGFVVPQYMQETLDTFQNSNNQVLVTVPAQKQTTTSRPKATAANGNTPPNISIAAQSLTPELKNLLVSLGLLNPDGTQAAMASTTTTTSAPPPLIQYIAINPTIDPSSYLVFKPLPLGNAREQQRNSADNLSDDMRSFLAKFGLTADAEDFRSQKSMKVETDKSSSTSTTTTTTTEEPSSQSGQMEDKVVMEFPGMPGINADALTDDMKNVLENIGLMKKSRRTSKRVIFNPATRTAGLLNQSEEKEKVSKLLTTIKELSAAEKNKSLSPDEVAAHLKNVTASLVEESKEEQDQSELELVEGEGSEMSFEGYEPAEDELLKLQNGFVDDELKDDTPLEAIEPVNNSNNNELTSGNQFDVNHAKDSNHSLRDSLNPPDPLSSEELHQFVENDKNEVKRQQPNNGTDSSEEAPVTDAPSTPEETSDEPKSNSGTSDSSSPVEEAPSESDSAAAGAEAEDTSSEPEDSSPSIDDLSDSFGGENPPQNRPNGLYFLVDWNTFLRVGTDNKTVDLNFSPKAGDPKNFIPVTIP